MRLNEQEKSALKRELVHCLQTEQEVRKIVADRKNKRHFCTGARGSRTHRRQGWGGTALLPLGLDTRRRTG